jgi:spermidine/putrescine transport system ATP-binding protein
MNAPFWLPWGAWREALNLLDCRPVWEADHREIAILADIAAVEARGVTKIFGQGQDGVRALDDVSIAIQQNEFFTLLGPSGCGKTTLLRLIAGFELPSTGEILLEGQPVGHLPPFRRPVNTVFQSYALFPHMSVAENIGFGLEMHGMPGPERARRVEEMLGLVKLIGLANRRPAQLSGGQQQRVALARALANRPKVLLLDEPLSALDLKLRKEMQIELKRLQHETGITFIFVTHDQEEALTMSDRIAVMNRGRILQIGRPTDIYEHPTEHFVADFIGETNFLQAEVRGLENGSAALRFPSGAELAVPIRRVVAAGATVSIALRPERSLLVKAGGSAILDGKIQNIVYFGTDTTYYLELEGGGSFTVRMQNREGARLAFAQEEPVGVTFAPDAVQILAD